MDEVIAVDDVLEVDAVTVTGVLFAALGSIERIHSKFTSDISLLLFVEAATFGMKKRVGRQLPKRR